MLPTLSNTRSSLPTAFCDTPRLPAARTLLPARIAASAAGSTPTSPGPSYARLSKALASRRGPFGPNCTCDLLPPSSGSRCRVCLLRCRRCRIQLVLTLLDPPGTEMALYSDADMVRSIVGACQVKLLSGPAGSQSQDSFA